MPGIIVGSTGCALRLEKIRLCSSLRNDELERFDGLPVSLLGLSGVQR